MRLPWDAFALEAERFIEQDQTQFRSGDSNLNRYVGNDPTNATDPSGLREVDITLDLQSRDDTDWFERWMMPSNTEWTGSNTRLSEVKKMIEAKLGDGDNIGRLILTAHCGIEGQVYIAPNVTFDYNTREQYEKFLKQFGPNAASVKNLKEVLDFMQWLKDHMSENGKIDFVQCSSGGGKKGEVLFKELTGIFGDKVKIVLFKKGVYWFWGCACSSNRAIKKVP